MRTFEFIEHNIQLIDENRFEEFYDLAGEQCIELTDVGCITNILIDAGIDPLATLTTIPAGYLYGCEDVTSFTIPSHIKAIEVGAFSDTSIEELIIPEGVTRIGEGAFNWNPKLKKIVLPSTLKELGVDCFEGCENLHKLHFNGTVRQWRLIHKFNHRIVNNYINNTLKYVVTSEGEVGLA